MKKVYQIIFFFYCLIAANACFGQTMLQGNGQPETATGMRADGKIYVVVAVVVTILIGLVLYLIQLDRKISRLEKDVKG